MAYAVLLNDDPGSITRDDIDALRAADISDAEILHTNLVVGYFAFANRLTSGLGVELEPDDIGR